MAIRFVILEADQAADYAEFHKALDKVRATSTDGAVSVPVVDPTPTPLAIPPVPVAPVVESADPAGDAFAAATSLAAPDQSLAAWFAQQQGQQGLPVVAQQAKKGKRTDGLGMIGHKLTCVCPPCGSIKSKLAKLLGVPVVTNVPEQGSPEAAQLGAMLAASEPQPAPVQQQAQQAPTPSAPNPLQVLAAQQAQQAQPAQPAAASMPQYAREYPSPVYQTVLTWGLTLVDASKVNAMSAFLDGSATLDSLKAVQHKGGSLYDKVVAIIRKAMQPA